MTSFKIFLVACIATLLFMPAYAGVTANFRIQTNLNSAGNLCLEMQGSLCGAVSTAALATCGPAGTFRQEFIQVDRTVVGSGLYSVGLAKMTAISLKALSTLALTTAEYDSTTGTTLNSFSVIPTAAGAYFYFSLVVPSSANGYTAGTYYLCTPDATPAAGEVPVWSLNGGTIPADPTTEKCLWKVVN